MEGLISRVVDHPIREQFKRIGKWKERSYTGQNQPTNALRGGHLQTALTIHGYESIS